MAFPSQFLDELRARVGLVEVVGRRVKLIRKGREHHGLCPFHNEKTPSFTVNEEKGFYHCFGCGAHGSVIDFVMQMDNLGFPEAVRRLAADAGMDVPEDTPEQRERDQRRQGLFSVTEAATAFYEKCLRMPDGRAGLEYLRRRGLDDATIATFRLGYAPNRRGALKSGVAAAGVDEAGLFEAGLLRQPDDGRPAYDYFRDRVLFPISDGRGRVIAFGGRTLGDGEPKYLNSPETPLFHKGRVLYGLAQALDAVRRSGRIIVTEGYMDVIALHKAGFANAVAPLGTALTEDQLTVLWRLSPEPIVCFDGDAAGRRAAGRAVERALPMLKAGFGLRVAWLPAGSDPDSLIADEGAEAMRAVLDGAMPLSEALWTMETEGQDTATPEGRAALQRRLEDHARRIGDATVRSHFLRAFKDRIWGTQNEHRSVRVPVTGGGRITTKGSRSDPGLVAEQTLIAILLRHPTFLSRVEEQAGFLAMHDAGLDRLRQGVLAVLGESPDLDSPTLGKTLRERGYSRELEALNRNPVLRRHRLLKPDAPIVEIEQLWESSFALLRERALADEMRADSWTEEDSEEDVRRKLALIRDRLGDSEEPPE